MYEMYLIIFYFDFYLYYALSEIGEKYNNLIL